MRVLDFGYFELFESVLDETAHHVGVDRPWWTLRLGNRVLEREEQGGEHAGGLHEALHHLAPGSALVGIERTEESVVPNEIKTGWWLEGKEIGDLVDDVAGKIGMRGQEGLARLFRQIDAYDFSVLSRKRGQVVAGTAARDEDAARGNESAVEQAPKRWRRLACVPRCDPRSPSLFPIDRCHRPLLFDEPGGPGRLTHGREHGFVCRRVAREDAGAVSHVGAAVAIRVAG